MKEQRVLENSFLFSFKSQETRTDFLLVQIITVLTFTRKAEFLFEYSTLDSVEKLESLNVTDERLSLADVQG